MCNCATTILEIDNETSQKVMITAGANAQTNLDDEEEPSFNKSYLNENQQVFVESTNLLSKGETASSLFCCIMLSLHMDVEQFL